MDFDALSRQPDLLDWLWPADDFAQPNSSAPPLSAADVAQLGQLDSVRQAYLQLLVRCGLVLGHHGWIFFADKGRFEAQGWPAKHAFMDRGWARLIRHLELARFVGYSQSGVPDSGNYLYSRGLLEWLCTQVERQGPARTETLLALLRSAVG